MQCSFGSRVMQRTGKLQSVQCRATKMIPSLQNKPYEEYMSHLNLFSLVKRRLRGKLIECFKILNDFTNVNPTKLFMIYDTTRTRNYGAKCRIVHSDSTQFFTNVVVRDRNRLPLDCRQSLRTILTAVSSSSSSLGHFLLLFLFPSLFFSLLPV